LAAKIATLDFGFTHVWQHKPKSEWVARGGSIRILESTFFKEQQAHTKSEQKTPPHNSNNNG
jgi:hypothetical protein